MQTTTGISSLHITLSENTLTSTDEGMISRTMRKAGRTDWDSVIVKIDKLTSRIGAVILAASALYFVPVIISILLK